MVGLMSDSDITENLRRFELLRTDDESGVSGTGVVASGVEFPRSGAVVFEWHNYTNPDLATTQNGLSIKPGPNGIADLIEVHGHDGKTEIRWIDADPDDDGDGEDIEQRDDADDDDWRVVQKRPVVVEVRGPIDEPEAIETMEGTLRASEGDLIIRGVEGEIYPIDPDVFERTYREVN